MKLDLHGVKHADVDKELDSFLYEHLQTKNLQVEVVTGKSTTMKKIVKDLLVDYNLEVSQELENKGLLQIIFQV
jgi:DNA-nicking Smr family endonuclease